MKKSRVFAAAFLLLVSAFRSEATQITVNWPASADGTYVLFDTSKIIVKPTTTSATYPVEDGHYLRLVGTGFDINFTAKDGKLSFLQRGALDGSTGIRFDKATNTFSFETRELRLAIKNCDTTVILQGIASKPADADGVQTYKVIYGHHFLNFGGVRLGFSMDAKGVITFQDNNSGVTAHDSTITAQGLPFEVTTALPSWSIRGTGKSKVSGNSPVFLLPGKTVGYILLGNKTSVPFFVNNDGRLSLSADGPYSEFIPLADKEGADTGKITIPGGEAKQTARLAQEKTDQALHDKVLADSSAASWKMDFSLADAMKIYDFPEEQLTYPIELPASFKPADARLLEFTDSTVHFVPFQIASDGKGGSTISFRSDLPQGAKRMFRLVSGFSAADVPVTNVVAPTVKPGDKPEEAVLGNDRVLIKVPAGHQNFSPAQQLAQAPAPILGLARAAQPQPWIAAGAFTGSETLLVDSLDAKTLESGPLFTIYQITYKLEGSKSYTVTLELRANEPNVLISESMEGFTPEDKAAFRLNYGKGLLDPDQRLAGSGSGYDSLSGDYNRDLKDGQLNYAIGLFTPNGLGLTRSTAFYRNDGADALLISINRIRDWVTAKRALWSSLSAYENLRFYSIDGRKYLTAGLSGSKRYWALALIPRDQVILNVLPGDKSLGAGPESRLFNTLTFWSLNAYKDRMPDWPEKLDAAPFDSPGFVDYQYNKPYTVMSYDDYKKKFMDNNTYFHDVINYSSDFGGYSDRAVPAYFAEYAISRSTWTPEQRAQIRQWLLLLADYVASDDNQPHHSMLSGHPNFVMDTKQAIPFAVATFPNHPKAKVWRDAYMEFYNEWLDKYARKDVPELNTTGGRWTENIACYVGQCFVGLAPDQILLKSYDGTTLTENPQLTKLLEWMRDSFMSPNDGVRLLPPQGAHSYNFEPDHIGRVVLFDFCAAIAKDAPQISQEMRWIETNGKEGTKPDVHSKLFTDYGPVFHYDFAGPHESYAHLQNVYGQNYRWSGAGVVYYSAKGKVWSYNTGETNGDQFDWKQISAFNVKGRGLTPSTTDQLLYDFDFAQFYRQPGAEDDLYRARSIMMVRDDYLVISDEVRDAEIPGMFSWVSLYGVPQIYQLKPGAPAENGISRDPQPVHAGVPDRTAQLRNFSGKGDFLTVIAPEVVTTATTSSGATVNGEYVFASQAPQDVTEGKAVFTGNYGYARPNQLALFQGTKIGLDGFTLRRDGGDFGLSAVVDKNKITGRIVGRNGGKIYVTPPTTLNASGAKVTFDGKPVSSTVEQGAIVFSIDIAPKDGVKNYEITF